MALQVIRSAATWTVFSFNSPLPVDPVASSSTGAMRVRLVIISRPEHTDSGVSFKQEREILTVASEGHPIPTTRLSFVVGSFAGPYSV